MEPCLPHILGIWIENPEGAKFWLKVFNDLRNRGVEDMLIAVTDGLKGMPEALAAVYPETTLQPCIVHLTHPPGLRLPGTNAKDWPKP